MEQTIVTERQKFQGFSEKLNAEIEHLKKEKETTEKAQKSKIEELKQECKAEREKHFEDVNKLQLESTDLESKLSTCQGENEHFQKQISKLVEELREEKQLLEQFIVEEKINQKRKEDQNSLVLAVEERNLEKVSSILKNSEWDINLTMKFEEREIEGSVLASAIQTGDFEMVKMLVQDFGADVNQEITWKKKQSNPLIFAMAACFER